MGEVKIEQKSREELEKMGVFNWPIWEKEASRFSWHYDTDEMCYILQGRVIVETDDGKSYEIKKGDFVTFPSGLDCVWDIKEDIRKHYSFS